MHDGRGMGLVSRSGRSELGLREGKKVFIFVHQEEGRGTRISRIT